jgi:hypothetical protein
VRKAKSRSGVGARPESIRLTGEMPSRPGGDGHPVVASLNLSARPAEVLANVSLAERSILRARQANPFLAWAVLPELFTCAYSGLASVHRYAEDPWLVRARGGSWIWREDSTSTWSTGFPNGDPGTPASSTARTSSDQRVSC